jgi:hypothetical protein
METTPFLITLLVILLALYDLVMIVFYGNERSISRFVNVAWSKSPVLVFACGFLCGHFMGNMHPPTQKELDMIPIRKNEHVLPPVPTKDGDRGIFKRDYNLVA